MAPGTIIDDARWESRKEAAGSVSYPCVKMVAGMAWSGRQLRPAEFTYELTASDVEEIEQALEAFKGQSRFHPLQALLVLSSHQASRLTGDFALRFRA